MLSEYPNKGIRSQFYELWKCPWGHFRLKVARKFPSER
jgi:hypothetical protein